MADESRSQKTICLAVTPAMKALGVAGRPRLFEVEQRMREVRRTQPGAPTDYIIAPPRMARYMEVSVRIYQIYLRFVAAEDIHVYSVDEVFIDVTPYLFTYRLTPHELCIRIIREVLAETGITATAGIGTNLYLAKVAMDIVAKKMPADADGVRIAELNEQTYRRTLWAHEPITDFWRVGRGTARRLEAYGIRTMGQLARASLRFESHLYKLFGVNAELLIDHAWGWEPCTIAAIKAYRPASSSICSGQVLTSAYTFEQARVVVHEMADSLALELLGKQLATNQLVLTVGYDVECVTNPEIFARYRGPVVTDSYGRMKPKHAHGTTNLAHHTCASSDLIGAALALFDRIANPDLLVRRLTLVAGRLERDDFERAMEARPVQLELFADYDEQVRQVRAQSGERRRERTVQQTVLDIKKRFGKNAVLKGINFADGATARDRNRQIGGHKA